MHIKMMRLALQGKWGALGDRGPGVPARACSESRLDSASVPKPSDVDLSMARREIDADVNMF
jgi:hypothetical protein